MYTIKDLQKQTGLKYQFIRRSIKYLKDVLDPYIQRGDFNSLLIDSNGLVIFERIRELKEQGLGLNEIKRKLEKELGKDEKGDSKVSQTDSQSYQTEEITPAYLINKVWELNSQLHEEKERFIRDITEREQTIKQLAVEKEILTGTLKLLPEGKTPEEIKQEHEQRQTREKEIIRTISDLENTGTFSFKRKRRLIKRLRELL